MLDMHIIIQLLRFDNFDLAQLADSCKGGTSVSHVMLSAETLPMSPDM